LTLIGIFDIRVAEDMSEQQPYHPPIPEAQRTPHEGGNGTLGLPRTVHESAKPPPEKRPRGRPRLPISPEDKQRLLKRGRNDRYYQKHGEKKLEQNKRFQKEHREEKTQYKREYRKRNKELHEAESRQSQPDQPTETIEIFP
jgi:hypothetical protein